MRRNPWIALSMALALVLSQGACSSDDDPSPGADAGVDVGGGGDTSVDTTSADTTNADTGPTPDTAPPADGGGTVAPVKMVRDKSVCPAGFAAPKSGDNEGFDVEGEARSFNLRLPTGVSGPLPLLVYFHGTSDDPNDEFIDEVVKQGIIAVGPAGALKGSVWPTWDALRQVDDQTRKNVDVAFFDKLVDCLAAHLEVDEKRIYVAGLSAGGMMSNRVLRERSKLLAGGIVGSGIYELTEPVTPGPLEDMAVIVTWGGDNDKYTGSTGGVEVPEFNFVEQAALASAAYEKAEKVNQIHCHGTDLGHAWLHAIDDGMVGFLLAHPKGAADNPSYTLLTPPKDSGIKCSEDAATYVPAIEVTCKVQSEATCLSYCQGLADCAVENATVAPVLGGQLAKIGFAGTDLTDCSGCVSQCETDLGAGGAADTTALGCLETELKKTQCGPGIAGAMPLIEAVNACCTDLGSEVCTRFCEAVNENTAAATFFTACAAWAP